MATLQSSSSSAPSTATGPTLASATSSAPNLNLPSHAEVEAALAPYVTRRLPLTSPEWQAISGKVARKESKRRWMRRAKALLPGTGHARPQTLVSDHYETHWARFPWPRTWDPAPDEHTFPGTWGDEGLLIRRYGIKRAHLLVVERMIAALRPETALEVGCGNGINLLVLSSSFPGIAWTGVDLTNAGPDMARSVQAEPELPPVLRDFNPGTVESVTAHKALTVRQGDASALPFPDKSFDLIYTVLAIEQMQAVRDKVLKEIRRVARRHAILVEPFADANRSRTQQNYLRSRGYLDLAVDELPAFGLKPVTLFTDLPNRLTLGAAIALVAVDP